MEVPFKQRVTCTIAEACQATGLGRTFVNARMTDGALASIKVGRRRLIKVESLLKLVGDHAPDMAA